MRHALSSGSSGPFALAVVAWIGCGGVDPPALDAPPDTGDIQQAFGDAAPMVDEGGAANSAPSPPTTAPISPPSPPMRSKAKGTAKGRDGGHGHGQNDDDG